jgi:four helix bundle protein
MSISSYRDLEVWKKAIGLVTDVYRMTRAFPKDEMYGLTSQIRRAASSVPANIAEGWGRNMTGEYVQFLRIARGSLLELETHITIGENLGYISQEAGSQIANRTEEIGKMMYALIGSLTCRKPRA